MKDRKQKSEGLRGDFHGASSTPGLMRESGDQRFDGRQSTPRSNPPPVAARPPGSLTSPGPTRLADRCADAPDAGWDGPGFPEIFGKPAAPLRGGRAADPGRVARSWWCLAKSRRAVQFHVRSLRQGRGIPAIFNLCLIEQRAQSGAGTRLADDSFPRGIAIEFGQERGQIGDEFFALDAGKTLDGSFDFLHRAHGGRLSGGRRCGKRAANRLMEQPRHLQPSTAPKPRPFL